MAEADLRLVAEYKPHFQFTHSPLMNKIHLLQISLDPYLKAAMDNDLTDDFHADLEYRVKNDRNYNIIIHGETGSGKSTFAQSIYYETYKLVKKHLASKTEFSSKYVTFTRTEWLSCVEGMKTGDTLVFDEDDQSIIGTGALRQLTEQERIEKTLRQSQFNFIFCSPIVEKHVEHYIFMAFDIDYNKKLTRAVLYKKSADGLIMPYGVVILPKREVTGYQKKKEKFRKAVQARKLTDRFREYDTVAKALMKKYNIHKIKKLRTKKSLIQRFFPRFVDEEVKEIMTSIELMDEGIELNYSDF